ncbi:MAG TPA: S41 family peptidase [Blastocatellia bacterium]|nr:S41 family peptidase [Blastocatellia bacterium]
MEERDDIRIGDQFVSFGSRHLRKIINRSITLSEFMSRFYRKGGLSKSEQLSIINQALVLLDMNYVHLPLKRALHAVDPIQRLKLLKFRLAEMSEKDMPSEMLFHQRMLEIFTSARDIHTMYLLPAPFNEMSAYLPFLIEEYFEKKRHKYMVSRIVEKYYGPLRDKGPAFLNFKPGVEVLYWNGMPIARAIELNGEKQAGSNIQARFARGLDNLTIRPLDTTLPPDEIWVTITYRAESGEVFDIKQDWLVFNPRAVGKKQKSGEEDSRRLDIHNRAAPKRAVDHKKTEINRVKKMLFTAKEQKDKGDLQRENIRTGMPDLLRAECIRVIGKEFGYIRIFTFETSPSRLVNGVARILTSGSFPKEGLILDVRGNGGGQIDAGERLLQLFTPRRIKPELFEFINTPLNLEICRSAPKKWGLAQWARSIAESVMTNATYSSGFPITSEDDCNDIGQVYYGPVVLITDALSYSTTDIFAAGFQDNEIGKILGTSGNTGAGGANVWPYEALITALGKKESCPFVRLPKGTGMCVAVRRSIRVGRQAGRPLEELGIVPDLRHHMTRNDLLSRNEDLIRKAASVLVKRPAYGLSVQLLQNRDGSHAIRVSTKNIARLDVYINDRPFKTLNTKDGTRRVGAIARDKHRTKTVLLVNGYNSSNELIAMSRQVVRS